MHAEKKVILVTGATGQQGGATARELLAAGHSVRAMTRKPDGEAAKALSALGAEIVRGDLDDAGSLKAALRGVWGVFAVQNTWEAGVEQEEVQGKRVVEAAKDAGIRHFVYASVQSADRNTGIPHFDNKGRVEKAVVAAKFPSYVILQPVFFMENFVTPWFKPAIDEGTVAVGIRPDTKLQMVAVRDIGKYGRLAFEKHAELNGRTIGIAGDELTMPQVAEIISRAAGRKVTHFQVPIEEVRKFSEDFALMLEWFDGVGYSADIAGAAKESGVSPTSFSAWAAGVKW
jgi:uncharacterized protein YbjT (DUF2867 family)